MTFCAERVTSINGGGTLFHESLTPPPAGDTERENDQQDEGLLVFDFVRDKSEQLKSQKKNSVAKFRSKSCIFDGRQHENRRQQILVISNHHVEAHSKIITNLSAREQHCKTTQWDFNL